MLQAFLDNQIFVLLVTIFLGYGLGHIKIKGISLGNSACLFVAVGAGALGAQMSPVITNLGIIFFVYAIGLQAGPQFFRLFGRRGVKFTALAIFTVCAGAAAALLLARPLGLGTSIAAGAFAGAMTSTPALASAINTIENYLPHASGLASVSYAIAYPFGLLSEILFVQIVPRIYRKKITEEREKEAGEREKYHFATRQYRLTNSNLTGKTIEELDIHKFCRVNLTRYKHGNDIHACLPETHFELNDIVVAVGTPAELEKFRILVGEEIEAELPRQAGFEIKDIFVSSSQVAGKHLRDLKLPETYGVTVSRLYRGDIAIAPTGDAVLEIGDFIRVVGPQENVEKFIKTAGSEKRRLDDTNILILTMGMFLGALIGELPVQIGSITLKLGAAGGPLFVALILSHFGKIGKWSVRVPNATKFFLRDLGLVFFLIGVGIKAGHDLPAIVGEYNIPAIFILGAIVSILSLFASYFLVHRVFGISVSQSLGAVCGAKTSSPSLGILLKTLEDDSPAVSYAAAYPVALIALTIVGQLLVLLGMGFLK